MATPRARWSKVGSEILTVTWPREVKLRAVLLQAYLTNRWVQNEPDSEHGRAQLSEGTVRDITGLKRIRSGFEAIRELSRFVPVTVSLENGYVSVHWPNYAEFLVAPTRNPGKRRATLSPPNARSVAVAVDKHPEEVPQVSRGVQGGAVAANAAPEKPRAQLQLIPDRKPGRRARVKTPVPAEFTAEQRMLMRVWCGDEKPEWIPHLDALTRECLDHFRGSGEGKVDWIATVRNWVRRNAWRHMRDAEPRRAAGASAGSIAALWDKPFVD